MIYSEYLDVEMPLRIPHQFSAAVKADIVNNIV